MEFQKGKILDENGQDMSTWVNYGTIKFTADKVDVNSKRIDGTRVVKLDVGENSYKELAKILLIPEQTNVRVTLEVLDDSNSN